jgi:UDP-N-acetylmuramate dehydrogenase
MESYAQDRISKLQFEYPSAGCMFKNVYEKNLPAGKLIDELGFKGKALGDARVYENHANFIINTGSATALDVVNLIEDIKLSAKKTKGIELELEVKLLGKFDKNSEYALYHSAKKKK